MRSRAFRMALLVFQAIWLNAIVPGHTRGVVTLTGSEQRGTTMAAGAHCCPAKGSSKNPAAPAKGSGNCAVCYFAARITPPPVIDLTLPPLMRTEVRVEVLPASADSAPLAATLFERGPPGV
jgi:hypothetical protein